MRGFRFIVRKHWTMSKARNEFEKAEAGRVVMPLQIDAEAAQWLSKVAEAMSIEAGEPVTAEMVASGIINAEYQLNEEVDF